MDHHIVADAVHPIHGNAKAVAHRTSGPVGGNQIAATDGDLLAGFAVLQGRGDVTFALFTAQPFHALAHLNGRLFGNSGLKHGFEIGLFDIDQGPRRDLTDRLVLPLIGHDPDIRLAEGLNKADKAPLFGRRCHSVDRVHRQARRRADLQRARIERVGLWGVKARGIFLDQQDLQPLAAQKLRTEQAHRATPNDQDGYVNHTHSRWSSVLNGPKPFIIVPAHSRNFMRHMSIKRLAL